MIKAGAALLCAALLLLGFDQISENRAQAWQSKVSEGILSALPAMSTGLWDECTGGNMPVLEIEGTDFCAMIQSPGLTDKIPVAAYWQSDESFPDKILGTGKSPRRFTGSIYSLDLIIGGADTDAQFGFLKELYMGDPVCLTDMRGHVYNYKVCSFTRCSSADADVLQSVGSPLVLFVHLSTPDEYLLVGCKTSN